MLKFSTLTITKLTFQALPLQQSEWKKLASNKLIRVVRVSEKIWYETSRESWNFRCKRDTVMTLVIWKWTWNFTLINSGNIIIIILFPILGISPPLCHCASVLVETKALICRDENQPISRFHPVSDTGWNLLTIPWQWLAAWNTINY